MGAQSSRRQFHPHRQIRLVAGLVPAFLALAGILVLLGACSPTSPEPETPFAMVLEPEPAEIAREISPAPPSDLPAVQVQLLAVMPTPTLSEAAASFPPQPADNSAAAADVDIEATRTAAAHPPTPQIVAAVSPVAASPTTAMLPTPAGIYSWTLKVPILMYHYISAPPSDADVYRVDLSVTPEMFRQQMQYLRDNGYTTVDLYDLTAAIVSQRELPEKPIILTFDDGYLDNFEVAYPILKEFGHEGTFFVVSEFIDQQREGYMNWKMVEEMAAGGMRIESHSRTHPDLSGMTREGLIWEILGSRETIAAHIGYPPRYFCYPGGSYDEATIQMLAELDFWGAVTTANGVWQGFNDRFEWRRVRMRNSTTLEEFARLVDLEGTISGKTSG